MSKARGTVSSSNNDKMMTMLKKKNASIDIEK